MSSTKGNSFELIQEDIFARVCALLNARQDSEIAAALGVSAQNYATWKARGTIPFEKLCTFAGQRKISLDWLLLGVGEPVPSTLIDAEIFGVIFQALWQGAQVIGGDDVWPYVVANACATYNAVAAIENKSEREKRALMRVNLALSSLAHATISLHQQRRSKQKASGLEVEVDRLRALARKFDQGA